MRLLIPKSQVGPFINHLAGRQVVDRDTLTAAAGVPTASGAMDHSRGPAYLAIALLVATVALPMGAFFADQALALP